MKDQFKTFDELFEMAVRMEAVDGVPKNKMVYRVDKSLHNFKFNIWLQDYKGWEFGNEKQYEANLTKQNWIEYFAFYENEMKHLKQSIEKEKRSWRPQQIETKPEQEAPKAFEELFYNTDLVNPCIDILKELEPPLIDTDCNYIGKLKGGFCVWIDEMQRQGIVKKFTDRKIFASLIPQKIKRFSIDESMFGKPQLTAKTRYGTAIMAKVSKIKLSQDSH